MRMKKVITAGVLSIVTSLAIGVAIYSADKRIVKEQAGGTDYTITLNSSNAYTSGSTQQIEINNGGWEVQFKYTSCSASSGNHAAIADGGTITNVDHILSVNKINVSYTGGTLKYATSLDATNWSSYTTLSQGNNDVIGNPYYIRLQATGAVTLASATYTYSCETNDAPGTTYEKVSDIGDVTDGQYLIVYETGNVMFDGSLNLLDSDDNYKNVTITNHTIEATSAVNNASFTISLNNENKYEIQSASGYYIGRGSNANGLESGDSALNNTISFSGNDVTIRGSGGAYLRYNDSDTRFRYYKSSSYTNQQAIQLYKRASFKEAEVITGITAVDNNAETYDTKSVYNTANGLAVTAKYSTGEYKPLASGYTFKVYNSSDIQIDSSKAFPAAGNYYVLVSYNTLPAVRIVFTVAEAPVEPEPDNFTLLTDASDLSAGDQIVIACNTQGKVAGSLSSQVLGSVTATFSGDKKEITSLPASANIFTLGGTSGAWTLNNANGALGATTTKKLAYEDGTMTWSISIADGNATIQNGTQGNGRFLYNVSSPRFTTYTSDVSESMLLPQIYVLPSEPVYPTSISLSGNHEVEVGKSTPLTVSYNPINTNKKTIVWDTENSSIATVSNKGVVTGVAEGTTNITAKAATESGYTATVKWNITVNPKQIAKYTIMIYMCGSNLESYDTEYYEYGSQASMNLEEITKVTIPSSVNVIVQTGGSKTVNGHSGWDHSYASVLGASIPDETTRWYYNNKKLVKEADNLQCEDTSMGASTTFQSFLEWGINNYPAEKMGVIMWDHGGGMDGCCWDDRFGGSNGDGLSVVEMDTAIQNAYTSTGTSKLEWIGYDCCLMAVQDIADLNSKWFNYQISSQESEPGGGWDYDSWLLTLANNPSISTVSLGQSLIDSYVQKCKDTYYSYYQYNPSQYAQYKNFNDATLALLDLSKMAAYRTAWEAMASKLTSIVNTSSKWNSLKTIINGCEKYGYSDDYTQYNDGYVYDIFNASDFIEALANNATYNSVDTDALSDALNDLIVYNGHGNDCPNACGLCFFCPICGLNNSYYASSSQMTRFTTWRDFTYSYRNS